MNSMVGEGIINQGNRIKNTIFICILSADLSPSISSNNKGQGDTFSPTAVTVAFTTPAGSCVNTIIKGI